MDNLKQKRQDVDELCQSVNKIREEVKTISFLKKLSPQIDAKYTLSARNFIHYLAFRTMDIRNLQYKLTELGISSLARTERKVMASIDSVLSVLNTLKGNSWDPPELPPVSFQDSKEMFEKNIATVLGPKPENRRARIMVTLPTEAASNYSLVEGLIANGMNCARINCAHDSEEVWKSIILNVRKAEKALDKQCKVLMDLAGPKLRTAGIKATQFVQKARPKRESLGNVIETVKVVFFNSDKPDDLPDAYDICIPVSDKWLKKTTIGDTIKLKDARHSKRRLTILEKENTYVIAESGKTIYFTPGLKLILKRQDKRASVKSRIQGDFPKRNDFIILHKNDLLVIRKKRLWNPLDSEKAEFTIIDCSLPEFLLHTKTGETLWLDDGKIGAVIEDTNNERIVTRITQASANGTKLRNEKGINLPETKVDVNALTDKDTKDLPFILDHADIIGLSFVNTASDVDRLIMAIEKYRSDQPATHEKYPSVVFKIETESGFRNLPHIILEGMRLPSIGVMIARGDLAIECGFRRMAELQEQILWICEAAHIPAIWATQVLEGLAKDGLPSRSEISDASMGQRAECIMLNKGPYILEATQSLNDILSRMQDHQTKKRSLHRKLNLAVQFFKT